jgi:hypothetical protein
MYNSDMLARIRTIKEAQKLVKQFARRNILSGVIFY